LSSITPGSSAARGQALQGVAAAELRTAWATPARSALRSGEVDHAVRHIAAEDVARTGRARRLGPAAFMRLPDMGLEGQQWLLEGEAPLAMPAAIPQAICAASMAMVPLPQQGSYSGTPVGRRAVSQPLAAIIAAARVSFSGASPLSSRQPRLNSGSPEVSMYSVARVGGQVGIDAHVGPLGVHVGAHAGLWLSEAVGHRVLDLQRGKVQAGQRAVLGRDLDLEGLLRVVNQISQATALAASYRSRSLR
jgi:hypothetical protein